jgi:hypothetical protein
MHIRCTNGTPIVDTLDHLPPLPLFIKYQGEGDTAERGLRPWGAGTGRHVGNEDELGIYHALRLRDRVRHIGLHISPSTLDKSLLLMDKPFPILEHLSLSFAGDYITSLTLPKTFMAPNLRRLNLLRIRVPKRLRLLSSALSLVTLNLTNIQASGYFRPRLLVARLESLLQLEELTLGFSTPIPRPGAETLLLGKQGTPVVLLSLRILNFRGVSAYLERLISQIRAPVLERIDITLFNQIAFRLPHLSHFLSITEHFTSPKTAEVSFARNSSIALQHIIMEQNLFPNVPFTLRVKCQPLDWQIDCAAQICSALTHALSGVEKLNLTYISGGCAFAPAKLDLRPDEIDGTTWHEFLRSFIGVKELSIDYVLSEGLSRALEVDEIGFDPGLLPGLQELKSRYRGDHSDSIFGSFIHARQVAGRPVSLHLPAP